MGEEEAGKGLGVRWERKPRPRLFVYLDSEPEAFVADIRRLGTLLLVAPDIVAAGEEQLLEMQDDFASAEGG